MQFSNHQCLIFTGPQMHCFYRKNALSIITSSLWSINLVSLQRVVSGNIRVGLNPWLCYVDEAVFEGIGQENTEVVISHNGDSIDCGKYGEPPCPLPAHYWSLGAQPLSTLVNNQA